MSSSAPILDAQPPPPDGAANAHLRSAALAVLKWEVIHRPATPCTFPARLAAARRSLSALEQQIAMLRVEPAADSAPSPSGKASLLELRESPRMLRAAISGAAGVPRVVARLPRVVLSANAEEPRIAALARLYFTSFGEQFSEGEFCAFVREVEEHEPLMLAELWNLPAILQFVLLEMLLDEARELMDAPAPMQGPSIPARIRSLRAVANADWVALIEPLILFDATLRLDPSGTYGSMDFESRELYRERVAFVARHSDLSELEVAQAAFDLAHEATECAGDDERVRSRRTHVGHYLIDKGFPRLADRSGFHAPMVERARTLIRANADYFYITGIELLTVLFIAVLMAPLLPRLTLAGAVLSVLLLALPAMQCAVDMVNSVVTSIFDPRPLAKLNFRKAIPANCTTLVAVPTLLLNEAQVRDLVVDLEVRFLANRDPHLHFALLTDLPDSASNPREKDSHPLVELATHLIEDLNAKYASARQGSFILLHRHRVFNRKQGVWMGWERKRGKILDLNKLLVGEFDAFPIKAGRLNALDQVRYVLALDSDTQLPRGSAAKMIGAIAHPLNQAIIDPKLRIVTEGYGILQPRIGVTVQSAARSRLAAIFSGQSGFDIYARAISDPYQELYGEGIFTGKGIYEVAAFHAVLDRRFPRNSLLSHDLIEGAYVRAGLTTDIELIDDYPSHYSAYTRRKHRWVRGDWQIARWMFAHVPEESGRTVRNPISEVSRWKIFDNLRRSLVEPLTFILIVAGWLGLPGGPLYWTAVALFLLVFPTLVQFAFGLSRALISGRKGGVNQAFTGFGQSLLLVLINLVFLPHQTLLALDAIVRALVRGFITGERLLEWETAAEAETGARRTPVDRYLTLMPLIAIGIAILVYAASERRDAILFAAPIILLWTLANVFTLWLDAPPREERKRLGSADESFLMEHALRVWRYFHQFASARHNYLIPDNVEEAGLFEAARVSPTNLGLLLNARQAACELGFLTPPEFVALTNRSLSTIHRLEKFRGHLFNWYNTETLEVLGGRSVSSVDSGNFVASLYTLEAGALDLLKRPLFDRQLFTGLRACWRMLPLRDKHTARLARLSLPASSATTAQWILWLAENAEVASDSLSQGDVDSDAQWWIRETRQRIDAILALVHSHMPWMLPEFAPLRNLDEPGINPLAESLSIDGARAFCQQLEATLAPMAMPSSNRSEHLAIAERLRAALPAAQESLSTLQEGLRRIADDSARIAEETRFDFLVQPGRQMLSVGYDAGANVLHDACYDMLGSEARIATFLAVARDELPQESWFKMGRAHTRAFGRFVLLSWTGTMFEYLMPALWMRNYPETLIARTLSSCVHIQRGFAHRLKAPWGISESGYARKDEGGHYHYQAFGIPAIALKFDATAGPVISPYSTFLALGVDSIAALRNLRQMVSAGWSGAYGLYESADLAAAPGKTVMVREWMAHHQGMSLLAVLNLLRENVVQRWFHSNPMVQATELLLHEMPVNKAVLKAELKNLAPFKATPASAA
jgi:hypothetical protein